MRKLRVAILGLLVICVFWSTPSHSEGKSLKEIYKTGKVRFEEVVRISNETLPAHARYKFCNDLMVDGENNLFVADSETQHIFKFSPQGKIIKVIGQYGQGPGDLFIPMCLTHDGKYFYVFEFGNERFSVFDFAGNFIKIYKPKEIEKRGLINHMEVLPNGDFIVGREKNYKKGNPPMEMFLEIYSPAFEFKKQLYSQRFSRYRYVGKTAFRSPFNTRVRWDMLPDGRIVLGFSENFLLYVFDLDKGTQSTIQHDCQPVKVTEKDKEAFFLNLVGYKKGDEAERNYIRKNTVFPKYKPIFNNIITDYDGNILVFPHINSSFFYAFDRKCEFIGKVEILSGEILTHRVLSTRDRYFWVADIDKHSNPFIAKYKIAASRKGEVK